MAHDSTKEKLRAKMEDEIDPLTGKPYFHVTLTKSALDPAFLLVIPKEGRDILPKTNMTTYLKRGIVTWEVMYYGEGVQKHFDKPGWTQFATDNALEVDDVCIFELMSSTSTTMNMKVTVLGGTFPPELMEGESSEKPIVVE